MNLKSIVLAGCAIAALGAAPAYATKAQDAREAKITEQLNAQQVQNPGSMPSAQTASASKQDMAANSTQTGMNAGTTTGSNANSSTLGSAAATTGNEIDKAVGAKTPVTNAEMRKGVAANEVADPTKTLATAELKTRAGDPVGEVKAVKVNADGSAKAVEADVGGFLGVGEREVNINAGNLRYIKDRNILVTDMTKPQIEDLPPVDKTY